MTPVHQPHRPVAERRDQLMDAAVELIREGGLATATSRAIAGRAGLKSGAFHYCFPSHTALLDALAERELGHTPSGMWPAPGPGPQTGIAAALQTYVDRVRADEGRYLVVAELTLRALRTGDSPAVQAAQLRQLTELTELVDSWPAPAGPGPALPAETMARAMAAAASALAAFWLATHDVPALEAQLQHFAGALGGMWAGGPAVEPARSAGAAG